MKIKKGHFRNESVLFVLKSFEKRAREKNFFKSFSFVNLKNPYAFNNASTSSSVGTEAIAPCLETASAPTSILNDLYIKVTKDNEKGLDRSLAAIKRSPGTGRVCVYYKETGKLYSPKGLTASCEEGLLDTLRGIMGAENIALKQRSR